MTLREAMQDWLRDIGHGERLVSLPTERLLSHVEAKYAGGVRQFLTDSPDANRTSQDSHALAHWDNAGICPWAPDTCINTLLGEIAS